MTLTTEARCDAAAIGSDRCIYCLNRIWGVVSVFAWGRKREERREGDQERFELDVVA